MLAEGPDRAPPLDRPDPEFEIVAARGLERTATPTLSLTARIIDESGIEIYTATLSVLPEVPVAGMALILGVDRFMSECRALTNFVGNAVVTIVVARWEGALDRDALARALATRMAVPEPAMP